MDIVVACVKNLVQRVKNEMELLKGTGKNFSININKCWNIIRSLAEYKEYI